MTPVNSSRRRDHFIIFFLEEFTGVVHSRFKAILLHKLSYHLLVKDNPREFLDGLYEKGLP